MKGILQGKQYSAKCLCNGLEGRSPQEKTILVVGRDIRHAHEIVESILSEEHPVYADTGDFNEIISIQRVPLRAGPATIGYVNTGVLIEIVAEEGIYPANAHLLKGSQAIFSADPKNITKDGLSIYHGDVLIGTMYKEVPYVYTTIKSDEEYGHVMTITSKKGTV